MAKRIIRDAKQKSNKHIADTTGASDERVASQNKLPVSDNVLLIAGTGGGRTKSTAKANLLHAQRKSQILLAALMKLYLLDRP